jgi:aryl-alcohol dehydrogenase-like predicted oxidoreductase
MKLVRWIEGRAKKKCCAVISITIGWIKVQSGFNGLPTIIPILDATTVARADANMTSVELIKEQMAAIDKY